MLIYVYRCPGCESVREVLHQQAPPPNEDWEVCSCDPEASWIMNRVPPAPTIHFRGRQGQMGEQVARIRELIEESKKRV